MIRPPPLKLKYDNRFPLPIPSARRPKQKETFFGTLYKANWRNIVIAVALLNMLRYGSSAVNAYEDADVDTSEHASKLAKVNLALCAMYATASLIELYGIIGVATQRLVLVRVYAFLAFLAAILVTAASVLNAASFFLNAEELMYECVALALRGHSSAKSQFRSQAWAGSVFAVGLRQAQKQCITSWTQDSWTEVINVFLFGFLPSLAYYVVAYTYYRQTTDPSHSANLLRRSSNRPVSHAEDDQGGYIQVAVDGHNVYAGTPTCDTNNQAQQRRTGNLPSARRRANRNNVNASTTQNAASTTNRTTTASTSRFVSRSLKRPHRPPALKELEPPIFVTQYAPAVLTSSPAGYSVTPGPPTYGIGHVRRAGGSYVPVQPNLSCSGLSLPSARYDKFV